MNTRNPVYNYLGTIDCEIEHPDYGWIPFTASPNDVEPHGVEIFNSLVAAGTVTAYVPPTAAEALAAKRAAATLTPMEFELAVDAAGYTAAIQTYLADPATPRAFVIMWNRASVFDRMNADLITAATAIGLTDAQMDAVFGIV
jgi:hypothetical protein